MSDEKAKKKYYTPKGRAYATKHPSHKYVYDEEMADKAVKLLEKEPFLGKLGLAKNLGISDRILYRWLARHEAFQDAVEKGMTAAKTKYIQVGIDNIENTKFNTPLFLRMYEVIYGRPLHRAVHLSGWKETESGDERLDIISSAVGDGEITPDEAQKISQTIIAIDAHKELRRKTEEYENRIAQLEKLLDVASSVVTTKQTDEQS